MSGILEPPERWNLPSLEFWSLLGLLGLLGPLFVANPSILDPPWGLLGVLGLLGLLGLLGADAWFNSCPVVSWGRASKA